ncbi:MAG: hypothetical protein KJ634_10515 [Gammaproteobacteria bacterium]|nr:hypothetical protein [Gammaproteobacteria bacterium]MBU1416045.1 hypothetical protein [Gammaproteobacteria bacterium]
MASYRYLLPLALVLVTVSAEARIYCCNDDHGRRVCGDILPAECQKRAYDELNSQGVLKQKHTAPLTAEQRAQRDAELARKKLAEHEAAEQALRDHALLASYTSVADIDAKRERTLVGAHAEIKNAEERLDTARARYDMLSNSAARYNNSGKPIPDALKDNLRDSEANLVARQAALKEKQEELAAIKAHFDHDRHRFLELTGKLRAETTPAAPAR